MALKMKIGKSEFDKLPDDVKKEYKADGSDYTLDVDGYEDPAAIKRAKDNEVNDHKETKKDRDKHKADAERLTTELADAKRAAGGNEKALSDLRTELTEDFTKKLGEKDAHILKFETSIKDAHKNSIALEIANKISTVPALLAPRIAERITVNLDENGKPSHHFLDAAGKQTASNADDVGKEFSTNADYKGIIKGTGGSGGVRDPQNPGPGRAGPGAPRKLPRIGGDDGPPDLSKMTGPELVAYRREQQQQSAEGNNPSA